MGKNTPHAGEVRRRLRRAVSGSGTRLIHGLTDIGVSGSAEKQYLLIYHPKTVLGDAFDAKATVGGWSQWN